MGQMVFDLGRFLIIFVLLVFAFGASYSAFKWPNNDSKHELNYITVFVEPFIQGLGEVSFLEDIGIDTSECTNTVVLKDCWLSLNQSAIHHAIIFLQFHPNMEVECSISRALIFITI